MLSALCSQPQYKIGVALILITHAPPLRWVKVNVDEGCVLIGGVASINGVTRNVGGDWIGGLVCW